MSPNYPNGQPLPVALNVVDVTFDARKIKGVAPKYF